MLATCHTLIFLTILTAMVERGINELTYKVKVLEGSLSKVEQLQSLISQFPRRSLPREWNYLDFLVSSIVVAM